MKRKNPFADKIVELYKNRKTLILFLLVFFASLSLITIDYFTLRITSAMRAYIAGESEYSKGQKDALLYLSTYIQTEDEHYQQLFKEQLKVPQGDNLARVTLMQDGATEIVKKGFLAGRNNPADLDNMIWLYTTFHSFYFMKTAIRVWEEAEPMINEADSIDNRAHTQIKSGSVTPAGKLAFTGQINFITAELSKKERIFSNALGNAARNINHYLFLVNVFCIILILGGLIGYAMMMISRLSTSEEILKGKNLELTTLSKELDTFVYSASHDLRSPIASLKGLVNLTQSEDEPETIKIYLGLMNGIVDQLDIFIKEIIDFFRNKRTAVSSKEISLQKLIDEALALVQFLPLTDGLVITKEINADFIYCDELRVKIVLNNLISNAVKYSDLTKQARYVKIRTGQGAGGHCTIEIEDNGIGIKQEHHDRIFDMFFMLSNGKKGTGLGLYIVKEIVEKLDGNIKLISEINIGSTFTISIPSKK